MLPKYERHAQVKASRSLVKTLTYRLFGLIATLTIVFIMTRRLDVAGTVGLVDMAVRMVGYYLHERLWAHIKYGREQ